MSDKSVAEARTSSLLAARLSYVIKIPDSTMWGGKPRIDFIGADHKGRFWGVEVKAVRPLKRTPSVRIDLTDEAFITSFQRRALDQMAQGLHAVVLLLVWSGPEVYALPWRAIRHRTDKFDLNQPIRDTPTGPNLFAQKARWSGSSWAQTRLLDPWLPEK